jgi:hypothetical protein
MDLIGSGKFIEYCRFLKQTHFTRNRKMPLHKVILTTLFRKGRSLKIELKDFAKRLKMSEISKVGYLKQRMKLNPLAFLEVARFHAKQFYKDKILVKTHKGYLILACDGSDMNVPSTPENKEKFHESSKNGHYSRPQAGFSCLFDVLNRQICDCAVSYNKTSERTEALSHIKKLRNYR